MSKRASAFSDRTRFLHTKGLFMLAVALCLGFGIPGEVLANDEPLFFPQERKAVVEAARATTKAAGDVSSAASEAKGLMPFLALILTAQFVVIVLLLVVLEAIRRRLKGLDPREKG